MSSRTVIVFGPTGAVGAATARTAHHHGAKVALAMRDPSKSVPGLTTEEEQAGGYERVSADLTQPESLRAAVAHSGAQHAFIYAMLASPDHMRASIEALKDAGVESVVLLSSSSIQGDPRAVPSTDFIAFVHAQVEINLEEVFGEEGFVAVRPAFFASNPATWWARSIVEDREVRTSFPDIKADFIAPEDIGAVAGVILAGKTPTTNAVTLVGPEDLSMHDAVGVIADAIGKEIRVIKVEDEEAIQVMTTKAGVPAPVARYVVGQFSVLGDKDSITMSSEYQQARSNISQLLGRPPTRFHEWVGKNRGLFTAE